MLRLVRGFFLFGAVLSLLQATVLHGFFHRRVTESWLRLNARLGGRDVPAFMRDPRIQRAWALFMTIVFGGLWWFTGTAAGRAWIQQAAP